MVLAEEPKAEVKEKLKVVEKREIEDSIVLQTEELSTEANLALALQEIPGVMAVRRSQNAAEPVIRGLGWERVQTQVCGAPQYGACPGRMDPPATTIGAGWVERVELIKGLSSVRHGNGGTAGRILVHTDYDRGADAEASLNGTLRSSYLSERDGYEAGIGVRGGTSKFDFKIGYTALELNDYESAGGLEVPAGVEDTSLYFGFGFRVKPGHRVYFNGLSRDDDGSDFPALPMNTDSSSNDLYNIGYEGHINGRYLKSITAKASISEVDHLMSNRGKPTRMMMEAETGSYADSQFAALNLTFAPRPHSQVVVGIDYNNLERDALRERKMVMTGATFYDHLWPDVEQESFGIFAEWTRELGEAAQLRWGMRFDQVSSLATAIHDSSLGGKTILEQWTSFNGSQDVNRDEDTFSGNLVYRRQLNVDWNVQAGIGRAQRAASMTERYYAFAPAPGGFQIGNPGLEAETKDELFIGLGFHSSNFVFDASVFHHRFDDFIHSTVLRQVDLNGDGVLDRIRGFRNIDARLSGMELTALLHLSDHLVMPGSISYVKGTNETQDSALPEIPPLEANLALRMNLPTARPLDLELGGRFVDRQDEIDPEFGENETAGFATFHFKMKAELTKGLDLVLRVNNLLDKDYVEHLSREVAVPVGDLLSGEEVPQPGRAFHVALSYLF